MANTKVPNEFLEDNLVVSGDLTVDTSTLVVDSTNNRVGIGTPTPATPLQVVSTAGDWTADIKNYSTDAYGLRVDLSGSTGTAFAQATYTATGTGFFVRNNGNVGIGTTNPAGNGNLNVHAHSTSTITSLKLSNSTSGAGSSQGFDLISNANTAYVWNRQNDSMIFGTNNLERIRIDSVGNALFQGGINLQDGVGTNKAWITKAKTILGGSDNDLVLYTETGLSQRFYTGGSERLRINSTGSVSIGTPSNLGYLGVYQASATGTTFALLANSGSGNWFYLPNGYYGYQGVEIIYANGGVNRYFNNASGTSVGSIVVNSGSTAFNTTSDYRLKDNPQPLTGSGEFIDALQPKTWTWNHGDGGTGVGFIAHEAAEAGLGLCVTGEKDATRIDKVLNEETGEHEEQTVPSYQQLDYSNGELIANMVAELQSLRARVAKLENS